MSESTAEIAPAASAGRTPSGLTSGLTVRTVPIRNCMFAPDDFAKLYNMLNEKVLEAAEIEVRDIVPGPGDKPQTVEDLKRTLRSLFCITMTVQGAGGDVRISDEKSILEADNLPDRINLVFLSSFNRYETRRGFKPKNSFSLLLDFTKPALLNFVNPASAPTENNSNVSVQGDDDTWTNAVFAKIQEFTRSRATSRGFLHRPNIYDLGLFVLGMPLAFWLITKVAPLVQRFTASVHPIVETAAYIYSFFFALLFYRFVFNYAKWAFPLLELTGQHRGPAKHRALWTAIVVSIAAAFLYDVLK